GTTDWPPRVTAPTVMLSPAKKGGGAGCRLTHATAAGSRTSRDHGNRSHGSHAGKQVSTRRVAAHKARLGISRRPLATPPTQPTLRYFPVRPQPLCGKRKQPEKTNRKWAGKRRNVPGPESDRRHHGFQSSGAQRCPTPMGCDRSRSVMVSLGRFRLAPLLQPFVELLAADLHVTNETGNRLRPEGLGWMAVGSDLGSLPIRDPKLA